MNVNNTYLLYNIILTISLQYKYLIKSSFINALSYKIIENNVRRINDYEWSIKIKPDKIVFTLSLFIQTIKNPNQQ